MRILVTINGQLTDIDDLTAEQYADVQAWAQAIIREGTERLYGIKSA